MTVRLVAALVGLLALLPAVLLGGVLAVDVIVVLVLVLALDEYARMAFPDGPRAALAWQLVLAVPVYGLTVYVGGAFTAFAWVFAFVATAVLVVLAPGADLARAADRVGRHLVGAAWIPSLLAFLPLLRRLEDGLLLVLLVLGIAWLGDTGGYFAGRAFGRRPLHRRISPKKTFEGLLGGLAGSVASVFLFRGIGLGWLGPLDCVVLGVILGGAGVLGDLAESLFKRAFEVKDSGWIMPGHGGILDRIDSVLFVGPLLFAYVVHLRGW